MKFGRIDFCMKCRKETQYILKKKTIHRTGRDRDYSYEITSAVCSECGEEMDIPEITALNEIEMDQQFRKKEKLITKKEIKDLMSIYSIGKTPLSVVLGFGEITVTRYLAGQMPSKEYSDMMRRALHSPEFMLRLLKRSRTKIADAAYRKAYDAASRLSEKLDVSPKILMMTAYFLRDPGELSPGMLQDLLYLAQGIHLAMYERPLFPEDCLSGKNGPRFLKIHELFADFCFMLQEDPRCSVFSGREEGLEDSERRTAELTSGTFGLCSEKALRYIVCGQESWVEARRGYTKETEYGEKISVQSIKSCFDRIVREYGAIHESGLHTYISDQLRTIKG